MERLDEARVSIGTFACPRVRNDSGEPAPVECTAATRRVRNLSVTGWDMGDCHRMVEIDSPGMPLVCRDRWCVVLSSSKHSDLVTSGFRATVPLGPVRTIEGPSCVCKSSGMERAERLVQIEW